MFIMTWPNNLNFWGLFLLHCIILYVRPLASGSLTPAFADPPANVRPKFRYWLPDAGISESILQADIANISAVGAGGFEFLPFYLYGLVGSTYGPASWAEDGYGTSKFKRVFGVAAQAARDNGVVMDFAIGANQGQGVPSAPETPGLAIELLFGNATISPRQVFSGPVPPPGQVVQELLDGLGFQHPLEQWGAANLTGVIAAKVVKGVGGIEGSLPRVELDLESAVDLTAQAKENGSLSFSPPEPNSTWRIFSFWERYTNQRSCAGVALPDDIIANGSWTVDHFSSTGAKLTTDFFNQHVIDDATMAELLREVGNYAWEDSMEILATLYWTPGLLNRFERSRGYSLLKYIPLLFRPSNNWNSIVPSYFEVFVSANSSSVNLDYRRTLNEGYQDYLTHLNEWATQIGTQGFSAQPAYNLPLYMLSDIPLVTVPELESLGFMNNIDVQRQFTGAAHLSGRSIISSEAGAVNVPAFSQSVPEFLGIMTRSYAAGVNQLVVHGFPYSGPYINTTWPGYTTFFYQFTEMWNQIQPAWQHLKDVFDFLGRNQWVLQEGIPRVDLALYLDEVPWLPIVSYASENLRDAGYSYEYLSPENLQGPQATVKGRILAPDGPAYKALIVVNQTTISVSGARSLLRLVREDFPVLFVGTPPSQANSMAPGAQHQVNHLMQDILASENTHQVPDVASLPQALASLNLSPQVAIACDGSQIYSIWRQDSSADVDYVYIFNQGKPVRSCRLTFSLSQKSVPFIYDAWTGKQSPLFTYEQSPAGITAEVSLATNQTMILAFKPATAFANLSCPLTVDSGPKPFFKSSNTDLKIWDITIESWHSAPDRSAVQNSITTTRFANHSLVPWKLLGEGYENVSGVGTYTTTFTIPEGVSDGGKLGAWLHLGPVDNTVRVYVDGKAQVPVDITNAALDLGDVLGDNAVPGSRHVLKVEVTSTLFNRIKADGDAIMVFGTPVSMVQPGYANSPPKDYGLRGPVTLEWYLERELEDDEPC
ncbi:hypothetical protein K449DRAFT_364494 [Hypoxylon sp. EC38]|nr:hypothetical protein K449DRAFT_364494 [Hypoxylon sp. EC38]